MTSQAFVDILGSAEFTAVLAAMGANNARLEAAKPRNLVAAGRAAWLAARPDISSEHTVWGGDFYKRPGDPLPVRNPQRMQVGTNRFVHLWVPGVNLRRVYALWRRVQARQRAAWKRVFDVVRAADTAGLATLYARPPQRLVDANKAYGQWWSYRIVDGDAYLGHGKTYYMNGWVHDAPLGAARDLGQALARAERHGVRCNTDFLNVEDLFKTIIQNRVQKLADAEMVARKERGQPGHWQTVYSVKVFDTEAKVWASNNQWLTGADIGQVILPEERIDVELGWEVGL